MPVLFACVMRMTLHVNSYEDREMTAFSCCGKLKEQEFLVVQI